MNQHKKNVIEALNEIGAYEVIIIVANWLIDVLLKAPHIQERQDLQDRVLACAQELMAAINKLLL